MPANTAIKYLHRLTTVILALLVAGFLLYQHFINRPPDDSLAYKKQISENMWLYVTKYDGGGATVSEVYRYYLDGSLPGDVLPHLAERQPFMVTDVGNAAVTGYGSIVNVRVTGRVYSFTNSDLFYNGDTAIMPVINLDANGIR
ncbi:hypothetical protein [Kluyvera ascorbata]|uniref:hypothetical protein n=1 Tax=Kluyvera ascorbata TaxID=51288 RepID=UPI0029403049|nr:hypothetical protein [Kluyvera ascorbata]HED1307641.1 hypothetical protein [Kluyvera ascorbata]